MFGRLFDLSPGRGRRRTPSSWSASNLPTRPTVGTHVLREVCVAARPRVEPAHASSDPVLDEPTTGSIPRSRQRDLAIVRELVGEGTTIMLTTQYLEEADQLRPTGSR